MRAYGRARGGALTVREGSSRITVPTPTSTASLSRRRRCTASRDCGDVNLLALTPRSSTAPLRSASSGKGCRGCGPGRGGGQGAIGVSPQSGPRSHRWRRTRAPQTLLANLASALWGLTQRYFQGDRRHGASGRGGVGGSGSRIEGQRSAESRPGARLSRLRSRISSAKVPSCGGNPPAHTQTPSSHPHCLRRRPVAWSHASTAAASTTPATVSRARTPYRAGPRPPGLSWHVETPRPRCTPRGPQRRA